MAVEAARAPAPRAAREITPGRWWWLEPALTVLSYTAFFAYATWSVFSNTYVFADPYVSPFFSTWAGFGSFRIPIIGWLVPFLAVIPLGLRLTCYYYRKSYFRSFFWDPAGCAINERRRGRYTGERRLPWVLNNTHRYWILLTLVVTFFLWVDVVRAFIFHGHFMIGLGSIVMLINVILLTLYAGTCHSLRYLTGGHVDCFSCVRAGKLRYRVAGFLSRLNPSHGAWAWYSMFSVALTDVYIRLVMTGVIHDPRWIS